MLTVDSKRPTHSAFSTGKNVFALMLNGSFDLSKSAY